MIMPLATAKSTQRRRAGFTLLEVVVGMMLMASLVVGSLTALSRYRRSLVTAAHKRQAIIVADDLLNQWVQSSNGLPGTSVGQVASGLASDLDSEVAFRWQTQVLSQRVVCGVQTEIVRLEIWRQQTGQQKGDAAHSPLATVDYLRPANSIQRRF